MLFWLDGEPIPPVDPFSFHRIKGIRSTYVALSTMRAKRATILKLLIKMVQNPLELDEKISVKQP